MSTKERILAESIQLFNEKGFSNSTMRDIAERVGISPGNLAYHYKNKDFIVEELFMQMEEERKSMLTEAQLIPSFDNINLQVRQILDLTDKYQFFYLDVLDIVRAYPNLAEMHRNYIEGHIQYIKAMLDHSVGIGNMRPEAVKGQYQRLAHTVWMVIFFWLMQEKVRGVESTSEELYKVLQVMWELVLPHLTEQGMLHFQKMGAFS
ncbi:TetR/AcrR family transcriptional regulator [Limibacter armeniacum]|uniref:TetR/AcrR family transcriptional regulator n=1 Tax=Limibacter armeniacum TaxID=466084 RepID=UPI002FE4FC44